MWIYGFYSHILYDCVTFGVSRLCDFYVEGLRVCDFLLQGFKVLESWVTYGVQGLGVAGLGI